MSKKGKKTSPSKKKGRTTTTATTITSTSTRRSWGVWNTSCPSRSDGTSRPWWSPDGRSCYVGPRRYSGG